MAIDASAVARGMGIETRYEDLRDGGVLFLPQRIAVFAQGTYNAVYSLDKFQATSAYGVGSRMGFGSPAHLIARELFPADGSGVGTIPVTFYPLEAAEGATQAQGKITPSGSSFKAGTYRVSVGNLLSPPFTIPAGASVTTMCSLIGEAIASVLEMPVLRGYTYGAVTSAAVAGMVGNGTLTSLSVSGVAVPGDHRLVCNTAVANGGVFSLFDPNGRLISDALTMTPGAGLATALVAGSISFTLTDGATNFAVGDEFTITVPATDVGCLVKWAGDSGNAVRIAVLGEDLGATFTIEQPSGGLTNPSLDDALGLMGNTRETLVLNALNIEDTDALDAIQTVGESRWGELVRKPFVAFTGNTEADVGVATAVSSARPTDRVNAQLVAPGSDNLPFVVAARQLAKIAVVANNNPPTDYAAQRATGLTPGAEVDQWDYAERDQAVKAGSSTIEVKNGVVEISDVVTFYRPEGEPVPAYRYVVDIVKLQNILFNLDLIFAQPEWAGAPLIPDSQPTVNPNARKPKSAVAEVNAMIDSLGLEAIISDPKTAKKSTSASINSQNPKRLDLETTVQLSGNANIVSATLKFGFFFGSQAVIG